MHKCCKKCVDKKQNTCVVMNLEEADSLDANNNNVVISNEANITITNEQRSFEDLDAPIVFHCDEVNIPISEQRHHMLQNERDEVNASTTQH